MKYVAIETERGYTDKFVKRNDVILQIIIMPGYEEN